jgi:hypothetical protein
MRRIKGLRPNVNWLDNRCYEVHPVTPRTTSPVTITKPDFSREIQKFSPTILEKNPVHFPSGNLAWAHRAAQEPSRFRCHTHYRRVMPAAALKPMY